jgi:hypothetical protein
MPEGIPLHTDRAAYNADDYPTEHTNDTDTATGIHHTLGTGENNAAAGDHTHAQLHDAVTVADTTTIDMSLTGQQVSGAVLPGGIKLDDLGAPDDNTDLNATTSVHGLLPKLGGGTDNFLRADGTWAEPPAGGDMALDDLTDVDAAAPNDGDVLTWDDDTSAWVAAAGTGSVAAFTDLDDVPPNYTDDGGKLVRVNLAETALEFIDPPAGTGDVVGPAGATDGNLALFDGATGKAIKDGGAPISELDDLSDVDAASPDDEDVLTWDADTSAWIAAPGGGSADVPSALKVYMATTFH